MTKRFCDICGNPANESLHRKTEADTPFGKPYEGSKHGTIGTEKKQCAITIRVHFGFTEHRTGFGGPPDLCDECAAKLIMSLPVLTPQGVKS